MQALASQVGRSGVVHGELAQKCMAVLGRVLSQYLATWGLVGASKWGIIRWYRVLVSTKSQERNRSAAAWLCLLAVALLYAPLAEAALLAHGVDCCVGGFCNVPEHHHHKQKPVPSQKTSPMDCGHDMSGMTSCSMSCCNDPARPALLPGAFVLPPSSFVPVDGEVLRPVQLASSSELSRFVKPLSPPPRFSASVL
jgi:hypothetical protein